MTARRWGIYLAMLLCALWCAAPALAAPERLGDWVPDATPDMPGALSFSYDRLQLDLEGGLTSERTAHDLFKLRYTFSPKVAATVRYSRHDLAGGSGLLMPLFDNKDFAESYELDLGMNLMNVPATPADPAKGVAWAAGSSFGIGISGTQFNLEEGDVSQNQTMLKAYLVYSTDLSEELRAHTIFSSARLTGDSQSGSANRIGAGLDYALLTGEHPLTLMADGIIDIYNFREPSFNTSRVSRFDVGLRYRVTRDWYATLGWVTANDSESDNSGSGIMAGINWLQEPPEPCPTCPAPDAAPPPAEGQTAPTALAPPAPATDVPTPPLMAVAPAEARTAASSDLKQAASTDTSQSASADITGFRTDFLGELYDPDVAPADSQPGLPLAEADAAPAVSAPVDAVSAKPAVEPAPAIAEPQPAPAAADSRDNGVAIPGFPVDTPHPTPADAVMVRAGQPLKTAPGELIALAHAMARPPTGPHAAHNVGLLIAKALGASAQPQVANLSDNAAASGTAAQEDNPSPPEAGGLLAVDHTGSISERGTLPGSESPDTAEDSGSSSSSASPSSSES